MRNETSKLVTTTRLRQLLDCYGSSSSSWPEDERQAALSMLKGSSELNTYRDQIRSLDKLLEKIQAQESNTIDQHATQSLQQRIINQLPDQELPANNESTNENNVSRFGHAHRSHHAKVWIGSIAASVFIVSLSTGVINQLFNPEHNPTNANQQASNLASNDINNDFAQWAWEDVTGESLEVDTNNEPTTLLALVELELLAE